MFKSGVKQESIRNYYVTLSSAAPEGSINTSGNFVTTMTPALHSPRDEYDVGLVSVRYTARSTEPKVVEVPQVKKQRKVQSVTTLFPGYKAPSSNELVFKKEAKNVLL